jgi:hypothetical protein
MPVADGRDAHPYLAADARTSRDAGPYLESESVGRWSLPQDGNGHCSKAQGGRSSM